MVVTVCAPVPETTPELFFLYGTGRESKGVDGFVGDDCGSPDYTHYSYQVTEGK